MGVAPQLQPLEGMLLPRSTDIYPKELARDMREFFNSHPKRTHGPHNRCRELQVIAPSWASSDEFWISVPSDRVGTRKRNRHRPHFVAASFPWPG